MVRAAAAAWAAMLLPLSCRGFLLNLIAFSYSFPLKHLLYRRDWLIVVVGIDWEGSGGYSHAAEVEASIQQSAASRMQQPAFGDGSC